MLNLVEFDIAASPTFVTLPSFDLIRFQGLLPSHVQLYEAQEGGEAYTVIAVNVIRSDEKFVWESCLDLLNRSVEAASAAVRGVYHFNLLNFDVHKELKTFNPQELTHMLLSHSRRLKPGQQRLLKYSSLYALMQKLGEEEWGKIIFKAAVEVFPYPPEKMDLYVRRLYKALDNQPGKKIAVINDMSQTPLYEVSNMAQQERLAKEIQQGDLFRVVPEIILQDINGRRVLSASADDRGQAGR
ncbi:MAG TPA: hypothetical protein PLT76_00180 [Candidatus Omnitrophota bacterium]|nr:hypothetical protein [Candidatus Omnitrophota bacterium]HQO57127.1 hypothetical protein [Candidatus Omnitrophota bacterium]